MHGAKLAEAIKKIDPQIFLFGVGGSKMKAAGVQQLIDSRVLSVVGITEVLSNLPVIYRAMSVVKKALRRINPDLLILIDFPDFNFRVAEFAKKQDLPVLYYVSPQIWAWRQGRVKAIKRLVDHMAVIFPFEAAFYRKHGVPVTFVGHPLLDRIPLATRPPTASEFADKPIIGLLPGSREKEVSTLLPIMLDSCKKINRIFPTSRFVLSCSDSINTDQLVELVDKHQSDVDIDIIHGPVERVIKQSHVLVAASGTVTLEAALHGVPVVIIYKVSPISYWLGKRLIKVKHIGIVNLIAQKGVLPELIQDDASPENIAQAVAHMINNPKAFLKIKNELYHLQKKLGGPGASERVARIALSFCTQKNAR